MKKAAVDTLVHVCLVPFTLLPQSGAQPTHSAPKGQNPAGMSR
jgi:hypothetical protein